MSRRELSPLDSGCLVLTKYSDRHLIPEWVRIMKLQEEAGEVADAYVQHLGLNPRKLKSSKSVSFDDIIEELADLALAALVAIRSLGEQPEQRLMDRMAFVIDRLEREG